MVARTFACANVPALHWFGRLCVMSGPVALDTLEDLRAQLDWIAAAEQDHTYATASHALRDRLVGLAPAADRLAAYVSRPAVREALYKPAMHEETVTAIVGDLQAAIKAVAQISYTEAVPVATLRRLAAAVASYEGVTQPSNDYSLLAAIKCGWDEAANAHEAIRVWVAHARKVGAFGSTGPLSRPAASSAGPEICEAVDRALEAGIRLFGRPFANLADLDDALQLCLPRSVCPSCKQHLPAARGGRGTPSG